MIAAIDLGSTNFKGALFSENGQRVAYASEPLVYSAHTGNRAEIDPKITEIIFFKLLEKLVRKVNLKAISIQRIAITSQAQTFLIASGKGNPLSPFYGWSDARADESAIRLQRQLGETFHRNSGWPAVSSRLMISKVLWWKDNSAWENSYRIISLPSYLAMLLGAEHCSDVNLAAMSGFYSLKEGKWWEKALHACGVEAYQLGNIVPPGCPLAMRTAKIPCGFSRNLQIIPVGNDHTAGAIGCDCSVEQPILTLGTAGVFYRRTGITPGPYSNTGLWGPYPQGGYYELQCLNHACSALDWANNLLLKEVNSPEFASIAQKAKINKDTPFFYPLRWGSDEAWIGHGDIPEKAYATFEGILFALKQLIDHDFSKSDQILTLLGGGSRLSFWAQMASDCFNIPVRRVETDGLFGAARLACPTFTASQLSIQANTPEFMPNTERRMLLEQRYLSWQEFE